MKDCVYYDKGKCKYYQPRASWRKSILMMLGISGAIYFVVVGAYFLGKHIGRDDINKSSCYKYIIEHEQKMMEKYDLIPKRGKR